MVSRYFFQEELQLNHVKHKQLHPQVLFETLTRDDQNKLRPVHFLFKRETILPSLKNHCHPGRAHFGKDQFPTRGDNEGEKMLLCKHWIPFSFDAVHPIQVPFKKPITKNAKTVIQHFFETLILRIRLGVENHKTIFPSELIWF